MYYAVLSDIHGNFEALTAVAEDARECAAADGAPLSFLCLGDVVDYGPQPVECVRWVAQNAVSAVAGNHDQAALTDQPPLGIEERLWPMLLWTRHALDDEARAIMAGWRETAVVGPFILFHSSLVERDAYISGSRAAEANLERLASHGQVYGLFGHTHTPCMFTQHMPQPLLGLACPAGAALPAAVAAPLALDGWHDLPGGGLRALLNPGSVGQPRRHPLLAGSGLPADGQASYLLLREAAPGRWQARFRRVSYAIPKTIALLAGLRWAGGPPPDLDPAHPLARRLRAVYAAMDTLLPATVALLVAQLGR